MTISNKDWNPSIKRAKRMIGDDQTDGTLVYEASLPFRHISVQGDTPEEASGSLFRYYCQLSRRGYFNPDKPEDLGVPPLQHVLSILSDLLAENISSREINRLCAENTTLRRDLEAKDDEGDPSKGCVLSGPFRRADGDPNWSYLNDPTFKRDNEVIAGLATAIAALARVKEL